MSNYPWDAYRNLFLCWALLAAISLQGSEPSQTYLDFNGNEVLFSTTLPLQTDSSNASLLGTLQGYQSAFYAKFGHDNRQANELRQTYLRPLFRHFDSIRSLQQQIFEKSTQRTPGGYQPNRWITGGSVTLPMIENELRDLEKLLYRTEAKKDLFAKANNRSQHELYRQIEADLLDSREQLQSLKYNLNNFSNNLAAASRELYQQARQTQILDVNHRALGPLANNARGRCRFVSRFALPTQR